jgi:hypothetical protein
MRKFEDGDLLVTPHLPSYGFVSVHVVEGDFPECYEYDSADPENTHLNHRIRISESFGLDSEIDAGFGRLAAWKAKLPWLRYPVLPKPKFEEDFRQALTDLEESDDGRLGPSDLGDYLSRVQQRLQEVLAEELRQIEPAGKGRSFEILCERLLKSAGYQVVARNQYDGSGGDVDLHCVRSLDDFDPFRQGEEHLLVQVKRHWGTTDHTPIQQLLDMLDSQPEASLCVMSLAAEFTEEAHRMAQEEGVLLVGQDKITALLLQELTGTGPEDDR